MLFGDLPIRVNRAEKHLILIPVRDPWLIIPRTHSHVPHRRRVRMRRPRWPQIADDLLRPVAVVHIKVNNRYPFYALVPTPHGQRVRGADGGIG